METLDLAQPRSSTVTPAPRAGQTTRRQAKTGGAQELLDVVSPPFGASDVCPGAGDVCPGAFDVGGILNLGPVFAFHEEKMLYRCCTD